MVVSVLLSHPVYLLWAFRGSCHYYSSYFIGTLCNHRIINTLARPAASLSLPFLRSISAYGIPLLLPSRAYSIIALASLTLAHGDIQTNLAVFNTKRCTQIPLNYFSVRKTQDFRYPVGRSPGDLRPLTILIFVLPSLGFTL